MDLTRESDHPEPIQRLTTRQRMLVEAIDAFHQATGEGCSASYLARRLRVHHSTIQEHLSTLYRKGWLRSPNAPAFLRDR